MNFPARVIRLMPIVESISQIAGSIAQGWCLPAKNGRKKTGSDSMGVVFFLDFRGHIDVRFQYFDV